MSSDSLTSMPKAQLGGGVRKKNGHKETCKCPICMNMKHDKKKGGYAVEDEEDTDSVSSKSMSKQTAGKQTAGKQTASKKKGNGHKANCGCPICMNMKKKGKKGGERDIENQEEESSSFVDLEKGKVTEEATPDEYDRAEKGENIPPVSESETPQGDEKVGGKRKTRKARKSRKSRKSRKGGCWYTSKKSRSKKGGRR
jgi:hypothetical protein